MTETETVHRADPRDPRLYHQMIDSTALPFETCVDLIVIAGHARPYGR